MRTRAVKDKKAEILCGVVHEKFEGKIQSWCWFSLNIGGRTMEVGCSSTELDPADDKRFLEVCRRYADTYGIAMRRLGCTGFTVRNGWYVDFSERRRRKSTSPLPAKALGLIESRARAFLCSEVFPKDVESGGSILIRFKRLTRQMIRNFKSVGIFEKLVGKNSIQVSYSGARLKHDHGAIRLEPTRPVSIPYDDVQSVRLDKKTVWRRPKKLA